MYQLISLKVLTLTDQFKFGLLVISDKLVTNFYSINRSIGLSNIRVNFLDNVRVGLVVLEPENSFELVYVSKNANL